ncbi:MAG: hypothetical protein K2M09_07070, partial [Muribaculaceae bacterium]|nr:hypothetical protein [Muribaculaceae bacterium]
RSFPKKLNFPTHKKSPGGGRYPPLSIEYKTGHHGARWLLPSHEFCKHPPTDYLGRDWGRNWGIFINFAV